MNDIKKDIEILKFYEEQDYFFSKDMPALHAFRRAISSLEKQVPKKPNKLTYKPLLDDGWRYECPTCKGAVGENIYHPEVTDNELFCYSCGQALDI